MDFTQKRKLEETTNNIIINNNGSISLDALSDLASSHSLTPAEGRKMIEQFTKDQLVNSLQDAVIRHVDVRSAVRLIADNDLTQRKLFIRGLGSETTTENLLSIFSAYGEIDDAVVVLDKVTGKSKGYGFVIFKHVDGALLALREPSKRIGGRVTVTQLAAAGGQGACSADVYSRKIYVGNVPVEASPEKLLSMFSQFGEIEEGPLGFDKQTGKSRGFALFVYKTVEGAQSALLESVKNFEGRQLFCRLAIDGKKKNDPAGAPGNVPGDGLGMGGPGSMREGQYGSGGFGNFGGYPGGTQGPPPMGHYNSPSMGGPGLASGANRSGGGDAGYGGAGSGPFGGYNMGPGVSGGYGGAGAGVGPSGFGGSVGGNVGGMGSTDPGGAPMYRPPAGGYPESGTYGMPSLGGYSAQLQHHQPTGYSPASKVPPSGLYHNGPSYH